MVLMLLGIVLFQLVERFFRLIELFLAFVQGLLGLVQLLLRLVQRLFLGVELLLALGDLRLDALDLPFHHGGRAGELGYGGFQRRERRRIRIGRRLQLPELRLPA